MLAKAAYRTKDLGDWAWRAGLTILLRPTVFPMRSVKAMRGCLVAAEIGKLVARSGFGSPAIFVGVDDIYFGNDRLPLVREAVLRKN